MKYNWPKLKKEFLRGKYKSLKDFAKAKGIPERTVWKKCSKWRVIRKKIEQDGDQKTIDAASDKVAELNLKHMDLAQDVINHGKDRLTRLDFDSASGAVLAIKTGIEIQREILLPKGKDNEIKVIIEGFKPRDYKQTSGEKDTGDRDEKSEK